jgi:branched-chain amino acid transport system ATP-binding protein
MKAFGIDFGPMTPKRPRSPRAYLRDASRGYPLFPLVTLFGLNSVDELDRQVFGILGPDIRDHFHLTNTKFGVLVSLTLIGGLLVEVPLGYFSDRLPRVRFAIAGAAIWALFGFGTGLAPTILILVFMRIGAGLGRAVVTPTHNSLIADYYPIESRTDAYGVHRLADPVGEFVGAALGGLLAYLYGWRTPFLVFIIPTIVFVAIGTRLREPKRGHFERAAGGASSEVTATDDVPPSFAESIRILWAVGSLRRIWVALPFLAGSLIGFGTLVSLYYEEIFNLNAGQRGIISAIGAPLAAVGLMAGIPLAGRLMLQDPGIGLRLVGVIGFFVGGGFIVIAIAPSLWIAVGAGLFVRGISSLILPSAFAALSLAIPPKVRSLGFSMSSVFILPGLLAIVLATYISDRWGIRQGMAFMGPVFFIGAMLIATAGKYVKSDINRVWTATATQAEALYERQQGRSKLLLVRNIDVSYGQVQVLFGVNFEVDEGEIVALLGTNGAGKSTLLKTICALTEATNGAVVFDGRDATYAPPNEMAARGVVLMPGGQGVFPSLTVAENLRLAGWTNRRDKPGVEAANAEILELFPILRERLHEPAGNLSGGQQQMLALGMAFIMRPRLLMIDELSLGLAPVVVEQLLEIVHRMKSDGITIILVEQSVNLALTLAETAFFMEKGEIRFHGPTEELLNRPDILRSVFLEGAASVNAAGTTSNGVVTVTTEPAALAAFFDDGPPRLQVENVSKRFGGLQALDSVSFTVAPGEIVGFLGPNGAGKTTLFDVISGFTVGDSGEITLDEHKAYDIGSLLPHRRARLGLGRSFQDGRLFPTLTVHETIAIALERSIRAKNPVSAALWWPTVTRSERRINQRVEELLELMGIEDFRDKLVRELSTGSKRIVDLACVMAHAPTVLLLDEPSSGIAQREAEALGPLLLKFRAQTGASLLLIEHDVPLMLSVADRVIALDLGRIIANGDPQLVVHDPEVVRSYLGGGGAVARSGSTATT